MVARKRLFFSTMAYSTIDLLMASVSDPAFLLVLAGRTYQKRHFRPDSGISAVDGDIRRLM